MRKETETRQSWEQARMVAYFSVKPHAKRNTLQTIDSLFRFPWEVKKKEDLPTAEDIDYIIRKYGRFYDVETDKFVN